MKVTATAKPPEKKFPVLKIHAGSTSHIVLFTAPTVGTVVYASEGSAFKVGEHRTDWILDAFAKYDGDLKLEN